MTPNDLKLCMGCMNPLPEGSEKCPHCGYQEGTPHSLTYLQPGTVLKERYLIGRVIEKNSEGATYISYDRSEDKKVLIREFMPDQIAERNESNQCIRPKTGYERQFKTALSDFVELSRQLLALNKITGMVPVLDRFVDNDTVYVVHRYLRALSFSSFLQRNGGELTWSQTKKLFLPLLNTLSQLHKKGIIHRGISPETILVDQDNKMWLTGFCIADIRTDGGEIGSALFEGYTAPEQYSLNSWQGTWTDVYGVSAVLYRALTGTRPGDGNSRRISDDLCPPNELNSKIPAHISDAIFAGMSVSSEKRVQSIDDFTGLLLEEGDTHTAVFESSKVNLKVTNKKPKNKKVRLVVWAMAITTLILLGLMFWLMYALGIFRQQEENSRPSQTISYLDDQSSSTVSTSSADGVPDFVGKDITAIKNDSTYATRFEFIEKEDYNEEYSKNIVYDQEPAKGTPMPNKGYVTLYVSKGSEMVAMPGLQGSTLEFATKTLTENELKYEVVYIVDSSAEPGLVIRTYPAEGEMISKKTNTVYLYIKESGASSSTGTSVGDAVGIRPNRDDDE
ncbi:MAG: PASTA domain-containing protein [Oscillospiraceae bacterium]|nr:PASTA domain-containing protein [Oscillospiraceae bacterium]